MRSHGPVSFEEDGAWPACEELVLWTWPRGDTYHRQPLSPLSHREVPCRRLSQEHGCRLRTQRGDYLLPWASALVGTAFRPTGMRACAEMRPPCFRIAFSSEHIQAKIQCAFEMLTWPLKSVLIRVNESKLLSDLPAVNTHGHCS